MSGNHFNGLAECHLEGGGYGFLSSIAIRAPDITEDSLHGMKILLFHEFRLFLPSYESVTHVSVHL